jgi:hypothetical protein
LVTIGIDYHLVALTDIFWAVTYTFCHTSNVVLQTESAPTGTVFGNLEIDFVSFFLGRNFLLAGWLIVKFLENA